MPKFNFGTQLGKKDSDPSKDLITKVKTFLILGAHAILLCFDLSDKNSFKDLAQQLLEIRGLDPNICPVYLIGCKSDLDPQVFTDEILVFSQQHQCKYFQTSSK